MRILFLSSEVVPFVKTGGLADVAGVLPKALNGLGVDIKVVMPLYSTIDKIKYKLKKLDISLAVPMGALGEHWCAIYKGVLPDSKVSVYFIEYEKYFARDGIYNDSDANGYLDNDNRFIFFSKASMQLSKELNFKPDILHANDWQSASSILFLETIYKNDSDFKNTKSLLTIHNIQYQGKFHKGTMDILDIGWEYFTYENLEEFDMVNLLKGAIKNATLINTVSQTYAKEIQSEEFGYGLQEAIKNRKNDVYGVVNGVDYEVWNPKVDKFIKNNYSIDNLIGKKECKKELQRVFDLEQKDVPIIGMVTRLANQKGIDVVVDVIHRVLDLDLQFILIGSGDKESEKFFKDLENQRDNFKCFIGYSDELAHKVEAGSDFFLMPSRFEPCGLNQLYSLKYGTLPIVRSVGGLNDTVENYNALEKSGTGFKFDDLTEDAIYNTVGWAIYTYYNDEKGMQKLIQSAMKSEFSWRVSAKEYIDLYNLALEK